MLFFHHRRYLYSKEVKLKQRPVINLKFLPASRQYTIINKAHDSCMILWKSEGSIVTHALIELPLCFCNALSKFNICPALMRYYSIWIDFWTPLARIASLPGRGVSDKALFCSLCVWLESSSWKNSCPLIVPCTLLNDTMSQHMTTTRVTATATILQKVLSKRSPIYPDDSPNVPAVRLVGRNIPKGNVNAHHPKLKGTLPLRNLIANPVKASKTQISAQPHITRPNPKLAE